MKRLIPAVLLLIVLGGDAFAGPIWTWSQWTMGANTPADPTVTPQSLLFGNIPPSGTAGEIAIQQAIIRQGEEVPLPVFPDGTVAETHEIFWTATLWQAQFESMPCLIFPQMRDGDACEVEFTGTMLTTAQVVISNQVYCVQNAPPGWFAYDVQILVNVVAVRPFSPIPVESTSFGKLKTRFK